ncbi:hypothetical protein Emed_005080 [Eimeria media]
MVVCSYPRYLKTERLTAGRRLSSDGSSDEDTAAWCAETLFESSQLEAEESEEELAPPPKVARLDIYQVIGDSPPEAGHVALPLRESVLRYAPPRSQRSEAPSESTSGSVRSVEELEVARALVGLQQVPEAAGEVPTRPQPHRDSPVTSPPRTPPNSATSAGRRDPRVVNPLLFQLLSSPSPQPQPSTPARERTPSPIVVSDESSGTSVEEIRGDGGDLDEGRPTTSRVVETSDTSEAARTSVIVAVEEAQPSTSSGVPVPSRTPGGSVHPFYRIPHVDPADQAVRRFSPQKALSASAAFAKTAWRLPMLRRLLAKPSLTDTELNHLAELVARLLAHVRFYETTSTQNISPFRSIRILGRRFILLDAALAALQVLGEPVGGEWWQTIVNAMPDHTSHATRPGGSGALITFNENLVNLLDEGLRELKRGTRLSMEKTIQIKRLLFCSPFSPSYFKGPSWEEWRVDDSNFDGTS